MKELFNDVLNINGVQGIILISTDGKVIFDSKTEKSVGIKQTFRNWKKLN